MTDVATSRLIVPGLGGIYRVFAPYTETLIRIVAGLSLVPHGYPKLFVNPAGSAAFLEQSGFRPGMFWAILLGCTEVFGGLLLAAGFLTRLACIPILIFLLTAISYHWQFGFLWNNRGIEYPLFWVIVIFHFLIQGGGKYSVDAMLGREV
jgi:putative oxidoreductase